MAQVLVNANKSCTEYGYETLATHAGDECNPCKYGTLGTSIVTSSMFKMAGPGSLKVGENKGYEYGRYGNPTRDAVDGKIAALEGAKYALTYSSGMAAVVAMSDLLRPGDHVIVMEIVYGGTFEYFKHSRSRRGFEVSFVSLDQPETLTKMLKPNTKMLWIESPANPVLTIVDIKRLTKIAHQHGDVIVVVDNTFLTSYFQRPLQLGADVVMYSCSKYMGGYGDLIMGALATSNEDIYHKLKENEDSIGNIPSPMDCYFLFRGLCTLPQRMEKFMENGLAVARFLEKHPSVEKVLHPLLPYHPNKDIMKEQSTGHSGMVSFYIRGGFKEATEFSKALKIFTLAASLGAPFSLVCIPGKISHVFMSEEQRQRLGITENLVRLSVGLETIDDLLHDLDQALRKATNTMSGDGYLPQDPGFATKAIHVGQDPDQWTSRTVVPPISLGTTFKQDGPAQHRGFEYSRSGNPTRNVLEACIAALDGGKYGLCFSSGLSTTTALTHLLSAGDHIVSGDDVYGGTNRYFKKVASRMNIETTFVDTTEPENVKRAIKSNTKMVYLESPTNPLLRVSDIRKIADLAHSKGDIIVVVDNTFLTSYFQRPLSLGADVVLYSLTKYMNGHTDVVMGAAVTSNNDLHDKLRFLQNALGPVPSPFDCYLVNRSLKTLQVRMESHMKNGLEVAKFLEKHPLVETVIHPGLPSHPQHELTKKQTYGHSGMLSFYLKGGLPESQKFLKALNVFTLAESLGGYESLAELPSVMTHASLSPEDRKKLEITDNLIRLSVGLESVADLLNDLDQALKSTVQ